MPFRSIPRIHVAASLVLALGVTSAFTASAQTAPPKPELLLYHASAPLPSYEVATIKPVDPKAVNGGLLIKLPPGYTLNPLSIRRYIMDAYGARYAAQIVGGPDWLDKDPYRINAKSSAEVEAAMQKMTSADASNQERAMKQSLLADRFHLKAHFEIRILPVYELVPAKGGLKISEVPAPPDLKPGDPQPPRPARCGELSAGEATGITTSSGLRVTNACAIQMQMLARDISFGAATEIEPRPIVDRTGFTGSFDIKDLTWAPLSASATDNPDAPSFLNALEKQLGIKVVPTRTPIEVLVIDSIERPTEN